MDKVDGKKQELPQKLVSGYRERASVCCRKIFSRCQLLSHFLGDRLVVARGGVLAKTKLADFQVLDKKLDRGSVAIFLWINFVHLGIAITSLEMEKVSQRSN